jgi:two-component system, NarL family, sensor histidine kinase BarA
MDTIEPTLKASLRELLDQQTFGEVAQSFGHLFDLPVRIFDGDGNLLVEADKVSATCEYFRSFEPTRDRCTVIRSRLKAYVPAPDAGLQIVTCFSGCAYAVMPVVYQTEALGKIIVGPYLPSELERVPQAVLEIEPRIDVQRLRDHLTSMRRLSAPTVARLSEAVAAVIGSLLFVAHKEHVTNQMHIATVREAFRELSEKNRQLEDMAEERREFDRHKSNFLAMVSHELRTPLTSIIGYSDMLLEGIAGDLGLEQKQFIKTIKTKGDELLKLISSILDFTQMDSGRLTLSRIDVDVSALVAEAVSRLKDQADRRGIQLSTDVADDIPTAPLDPEKMLTALTHLIDNAVKFSPPGGVVKVSARVATASEADGPEDGYGFVLMAALDNLEITIEDFGNGIADADQDEIFAPFTQIDNSSTREHGGAGLGLAIVKHYVEAHGGRVSVRSRMGEGSVFTLRLPLLSYAEP